VLYYNYNKGSQWLRRVRIKERVHAGVNQP